MSFKQVFGKIGNMRKEKSFVVYPFAAGDTELKVQSDNRIAMINLETGRGMVSNGKGGHQGFMKLSEFMGAKEYQIPEEFLEQLRAFPSGNQTSECGVVTCIVPGTSIPEEGE